MKFKKKNLNMDKSDYLFVIDTSQYAGNFERPMCAYLTGCIGECEVGREMAEIFHKDFPSQDLFENIAQVQDENGCSRPVTIWANPRWGNDGMGGHYLIKTVNQKDACAVYVKSVESIYGGYMRNTQSVLDKLEKGEKVSNWTIEGAKKEIARHQAEIDKAKKLKKVSCYLAYMSLGIWFDTKPTQKQIDLMKIRANNFASIYRSSKSYNKDFHLDIEGFRLLHFKTDTITENV